jgi:hypothetical protein
MQMRWKIDSSNLSSLRYIDHRISEQADRDAPSHQTTKRVFATCPKSALSRQPSSWPVVLNAHILGCAALMLRSVFTRVFSYIPFDGPPRTHGHPLSEQKNAITYVHNPTNRNTETAKIIWPALYLGDTEPLEVDVSVNGDGVSDTLARVGNDVLSVCRLGVLSRGISLSRAVWRLANAEDVRPLFDSLLEVGVCQCGVTVPLK